MNTVEAIRVRERPILFSAAMVAAILDNRKSQTRRVIKPQPEGDIFPTWKEDMPNPLCPFGFPGEHLWVREAWQTDKFFDKRSPSQIAADCLDAGYDHIWCPVQYADGTRNVYWDSEDVPGRKRNALHMPRWASRISLEITGIRVERLQDISEQDALNEGVWTRELLNTQMTLNHIAAYRMIWDSLHPEFPFHWNANPWVFVISFQRIN